MFPIDSSYKLGCISYVFACYDLTFLILKAALLCLNTTH